ncbi:hypothetical protein IC949_004464 [Salmonella enterica]|nr:hypothetical protein [Salmonella enterica]
METTQTRTYLAVPHDEKDEARKAAGKLENNKSALRFDDERKVWYALPGADMEALKRWKPDPLLTGVSAGDALTQFTDFLHANGACRSKRERQCKTGNRPQKAPAEESHHGR